MPQQTVLVVEAIDRLTRESVLDVYPMLRDIIRAGIVLLVCNDEDEYELYDEHAINGRGGEKLHSDVRAAYKYAKRLAQQAVSAHRHRRERAGRGDKVTPNGRAPGWIDRVQIGLRQYEHRLNAHAVTIERIFLMAESGQSTRQIAYYLNKEKITVMGSEEGWLAPRVGKILRDDAAIGYYTPMQWIDGKRMEAGPPALIYPPAIGLPLWQSVQDILNSKKHIIKGATGKAVPNLFSGHCLCRSCGGALRLDTGGGIRNGKRKRHLLCGRYMHAKACLDGTRYDLDKFERHLLRAIIELGRIAPKPKRAPASKAIDRLAALKVKIAQHRASIALLAPKVAVAPALLEQVERMGIEVGDWEREAVALTIEAQAGIETSTRWEDTFRLFRDTLGPALRGDVDARERLRGLLAPVDYKIVGHCEGALEVHYGGMVRIVDLEELERDLLEG